MKCVVAKSVLWLLLPEQKEHYAAAANDLIQTATNEPDFLIRDELWVYGYDPETKARLDRWKSPGCPCPKKAWQSLSKMQDHVNCVFLLGRWCSSQIHPSKPNN